MLSPRELRQVCPGCPQINQVATKREERLRQLDAMGKDAYPEEYRDLERASEWQDEDARQLGSTCLRGVQRGPKYSAYTSQGSTISDICDSTPPSFSDRF